MVDDQPPRISLLGSPLCCSLPLLAGACLLQNPIPEAHIRSLRKTETMKEKENKRPVGQNGHTEGIRFKTTSSQPRLHRLISLTNCCKSWSSETAWRRLYIKLDRKKVSFGGGQTKVSHMGEEDSTIE